MHGGPSLVIAVIPHRRMASIARRPSPIAHLLLCICAIGSAVLLQWPRRACSRFLRRHPIRKGKEKESKGDEENFADSPIVGARE